jgi:hypothetical protein
MIHKLFFEIKEPRFHGNIVTVASYIWGPVVEITQDTISNNDLN